MQLAIPAPAAIGSERGFQKAGLIFAVLALTLLDRFGLRVTAEWSVPAAILAMYALAAVMRSSTRAAPRPSWRW
jgi:hypothetical protein